MSEYLKLRLPVRKDPDAGGVLETTHVEVRVYYTKGGANYWSGNSDPRGINLSVSPIQIDGAFVRYAVGSGYRRHLQTLKRKSDREGRIEAINVQNQLGMGSGPAHDTLTRLLTEMKLELTEPIPA